MLDICFVPLEINYFDYLSAINTFSDPKNSNAMSLLLKEYQTSPEICTLAFMHTFGCASPTTNLSTARLVPFHTA